MGNNNAKNNEFGTKLYVTVYKAHKLKEGFFRKPYVKCMLTL